MAHEDHGKAIRQVYIGLAILAVITLVEVAVSLFGKGHLGGSAHTIRWVGYVVALAIILLSLYKAKFIIYEFMHMKYELPGLMRSVLLPVLLLVWAIIAFFLEGNYWKIKNDKVKARNERSVEDATSQPQGMLNYNWQREDLH